MDTLTTSTIDNYKLSGSVTTYNIELSEDKKQVFSKLIYKITKFCKHFDLPLPVVTKTGEKTYYTINKKTVTSDVDVIRQEWVKLQSIRDSINPDNSELPIYTTTVELITIQLVDVIKPSNEWIILGTIDHKEGLVNSAPNYQIPFELIPSDLHFDCNCDHCNISMRRNKTVFIKNNDTIMRVGGSCIKYYLGYDYEQVLNFISTLSLFVDNYSGNDSYSDGYSDGYSWDMGHICDFISVTDIANYFFAFATTKGYVSKSSANKYNESGDDTKTVSTTASIVSEDLCSIHTTPPRNETTYNKNKRVELAKKVGDLTKNVDPSHFTNFVKFVDDNYKTNNFLFNVKNMIDSNAVSIKYISYILGACSMYYGKVYYEELKKQKESKIQLESNWFGVVGEVYNFENMTITNITGFDSQFGWTSVYTLVDINGNVFTKFGVINPKFIVNGKENLEIGAVISFSSKVKKHDTYNGAKLTILDRVNKLK